MHSIGKPRDTSAKKSSSSRVTYRVEEWVVGRDVSEDEVNQNKDPGDGCLYAWYRYLNGEWTRQFVNRQMFFQLKSIETTKFK